MHGEAADKPRYSFNFRVEVGKKKANGEKRRVQKWNRRAHKKGKCSTGREREKKNGEGLCKATANE